MVVTGGSQGMGLSVAKKLAQRGANVVIVAQNIPKLENAVKIIAVGHRCFDRIECWLANGRGP